MSQRCTVRLPDTLYEFLQIEADARQCGVSDLIRQGLERLLGLEADHSVQLPKAPEPVALSTSSSHDCVETVMTQLPIDVREGIEERARLLDLPISKVVRSMLIVQQHPSQSFPQAYGTARPQTEFLRWQEINRQRQLGSEAALSDTAPPSTAPAPGVSPLITGTRT
jgi:Arc/MetJ-type ribon-helix-helix transcriptional regulator